MNKAEYGCANCSRSPKKIPYGAKRVQFWCSKCDAGHSKGVNKKRQRSESKKNVKRDLNDSNRQAY